MAARHPPRVNNDAGPATRQPDSIAAALRAARVRLAAVSPTAGLDAEVLLRHVLRIDRTTLFGRLTESLRPAARTAFAALVEQRAAGAPVAYLVGIREFMGMEFVVRPGVLIPRPETELLVEWALAWLTDRPGATVLDVGAGSGAIALSLAALLPAERRDRIIAADYSRTALTVAAENRARLGLAERVRLVRGDLATWCRGPVDLLLANLPYLRPEQLRANPDLAAEPTVALLGGRDGLDLIRRLISDAPRFLAPGGAFGLEIDPTQADSVIALVKRVFPAANCMIQPDLAGLSRHILVDTGEGLS